MGRIVKEIEKGVKKVRDAIKGGLKDLLGTKLYRRLAKIGQMVLDIVFIVVGISNPILLVAHTLYYYNKTGDWFGGIKSLTRHFLEGVASILTLIGIDEQTAYRITGYLFLVGIVVASLFLGYITASISSSIVSAIISWIGTEVSAVAVALITIITNVVVSYISIMAMTEITSAMAEEMSEINNILSDISTWLTFASQIGFAIGYGLYGKNSDMASALEKITNNSEAGNILSGLNTAYDVYGTYNEFMGYIDIKKELEISLSINSRRLREYFDSLRYRKFNETMDFITGEYYANHAGQERYNIYQPSREMYMPSITAHAFDGSTRDRLEGFEREVGFYADLNRFGFDYRYKLDTINSGDMIKLGTRI